MADFYVAVGDRVRFSKTVSESDVYLFAGITGDLAPNHVTRNTCAAPRTGGGSRTARC
jgi:3-hydroxybutyryl-CoA dehydratase